MFVLAAVSVLLLFIVSPFVEYVLFAIVLAYVLYPLHLHLSRRIGRILSPLVLIIATAVVVAAPLIYLGTRFLRDIQAVARGETELETNVIESWINDLTGVEVDLEEVYRRSATSS